MDGIQLSPIWIQLKLDKSNGKNISSIVSALNVCSILSNPFHRLRLIHSNNGWHRWDMKEYRKLKIMDRVYSTNISPYMSLSWEWSLTTWIGRPFSLAVLYTSIPHDSMEGLAFSGCKQVPVMLHSLHLVQGPLPTAHAL
jgi:hypothetical protein